MYGLEDPHGAVDCWVEHVFLDVVDAVVEGAGGVDDGCEGWVADDGLVEGVELGDVLDDLEGEARGGDLGALGLESLGFFGGADGGYDGVAAGEEGVDESVGEEATAAGDKDSGHDFWLIGGLVG